VIQNAEGIQRNYPVEERSEVYCRINFDSRVLSWCESKLIFLICL